MQPPDDEMIETHRITGKGKLEFADGRSFSVSAFLAAKRRRGGTLRSFSGRVWDDTGAFRPGDYLGEQELILTIQRKRLSIFLLDQDGNFSHRGGIMEGFDR